MVGIGNITGRYLCATPAQHERAPWMRPLPQISYSKGGIGGLGDVIGALFWIFLIGAFFIVVGYFAIATDLNEASHQETKIITIAEKVAAHGDSGKYLIIDTNESVYQVTDSLFLTKFDASDRYAAIHIGKTYQVVIGGYRNHFFSWYPNILSIKEVP